MTCLQYFQISDDVEVNRNDNTDEEFTGRSDISYTDKIENYIKTHDVTFKLPVGLIKVGARNLDNNELDVKLKFNEARDDEQGKNDILMVTILNVKYSESI